MQSWRTSFLFTCIIAMIVGLFLSRALLSIAMMSFVLVSFSHRDIMRQLKNFLRSPLLWTMSLLFIIPFISGAWSDNKEQWLSTMQIKVPLLVLPLAFAAPFYFSEKQWNGLIIFFISAVSIAVCWTIFQYAADAKTVNDSYLQAKSMVTPLGNDHVRFSWLVHVAILFCGWMFYRSKQTKDSKGWIWILVAVFLIVFLHLLAARTGLFSFYISLGILAAWLLLKKAKRLSAASLVLLLVALPVLAYTLIPSFRNRVKFFRYEIEYGKHTSYLPGSNDANRILSWKAGWEVFKYDPLKGVGFGDIDSAVHSWYDTQVPGMNERDKIYPSSEWLMYGSGSGIPGLVFFSACMLIPLFVRSRQRLFWIILNSTAAFSFIADIGLEVQFGVFIYSFIILWCWKWLNDEKRSYL